MRAKLFGAAAAAAMLIVLTGCSASDAKVASLDGATQAATSPLIACLKQHKLDATLRPDGTPEFSKDATPEQISEALGDCQPSAASGSSGTTSGGSLTDPAKSNGKTPMENAKTYAKCMREHGLKDFPDPNADGQLTPPEAVLNDPGLNEANKACAGDTGIMFGSVHG
ncbi:MAG TPA: hypothetical protein VFU07_10145 [Candidatus Lumbricidophila sp.]|nr:hypothetical protein [Candidatus Lumbricidophila sp.]